MDLFDPENEAPLGYNAPPKLSIVPPPPEEDVTVEATEDGRFWLTFIRDSGDTRGAILVTRKQLETFLKRGVAALVVR